MKKFVVSIEELVCKDFSIEANSIEEAIAIAESKYANGDLVLDPGEVQKKSICAYDPETTNNTEWKEF